jgi:hypothetical protein
MHPDCPQWMKCCTCPRPLQQPVALSGVKQIRSTTTSGFKAINPQNASYLVPAAYLPAQSASRMVAGKVLVLHNIDHLVSDSTAWGQICTNMPASTDDNDAHI